MHRIQPHSSDNLNDYFHFLPQEKKEILYSWGFNDDIAIDDGIQFSVSGFLFRGVVKVIPDEADGFCSVILAERESGQEFEMRGIPLDGLIEAIDRLVEKDCSQEAYGNMVRIRYESV